MLKLIERDGYLSPYTMEIDGRYRYFLQKERELTKDGKADTLGLCIRLSLFRVACNEGWMVLQRMGTQCNQNIPHRRFYRLERAARV